MLNLWSFFAIFIIAEILIIAEGAEIISVQNDADFTFENPTCNQQYGDIKLSPKCITQTCARHVTDGLFTESDIERLHLIVEKGMSQRPSLGGPTILDINTGYVRDTMGLENLFSRKDDLYSVEDFEHYGSVIMKLKNAVMKDFEINDLYFTAPTFITRLDGNTSWNPEGDHDEYWHPHVDRNNTPHYHYSGLLYMSTYEEDFEGGLLHFLSPDLSTVEQTVEPKAGRVVIFTSGQENPHHVDRVTSGQRYVLAFWFTCNPDRKFEIFLDGKAHTTFSNNFRDRLEIQQKQHQKEQKDILAQQKKKYKRKKTPKDL